MPLNIDALVPERHLIDLESHSQGDFGTDDFIMSGVYDDILLVEFIDLTSDGDNIVRNGIAIPVNTVTKAWRKGRVVFAGPKAEFTKPGEIVLFPNDKGLSVSRLPVLIDGKEYIIKFGAFLNEDRLFGKCQLKNESLENTVGGQA